MNTHGLTREGGGPEVLQECGFSLEPLVVAVDPRKKKPNKTKQNKTKPSEAGWLITSGTRVVRKEGGNDGKTRGKKSHSWLVGCFV